MYFFLQCLFCRLLKRFDFPEMKFSLYFMGYEDPKDVPTDDKELIAWVFSRKATIELTQLVISPAVATNLDMCVP